MKLPDKLKLDPDSEIVNDSDDLAVATVYSDFYGIHATNELADNLAKEIIHRYNTFPALVEALQDAKEGMEGHPPHTPPCVCIECCAWHSVHEALTSATTRTP